MYLLKNKPYILFWIFIPILLVVGNLDVGNSALDINVHDTYFVIANEHLANLISIYFGLVGLVYWVLKKLRRRLNDWLSLVHTTITIGGIAILFPLTYFFLDSILSSYDTDLTNYRYLNLSITIISFLVLFGQLLFIVNMFIGFIKNAKPTT